MKFTLEIKCDNAAFDDEPLAEVARILRAEAARIDHWVGDGAKTWDDSLHDVNGNKVGSCELK